MPERVDDITVESERRKIINRLKRLEGQVRGLKTMIDGGKECADVLTQVLAVKSALTQVGMHIIGYSMKTCLAGEGASERNEVIEEAFDVFIRYRGLSTSIPDPSRIAPGDSAEMLSRLNGLESELREIQNGMELGIECETILLGLSRATATIGDVGLAVLGHSMKECLVDESAQTREELVDEAIGVFLKYSACVL